MENYKDIYNEMMNFFQADNMEQVCVNLGFSKDSYKNWTRYKKVSDKALRRFNAIKTRPYSLAMKSRPYGVAIGGNAQIGGNAIIAGNNIIGDNTADNRADNTLSLLPIPVDEDTKELIDLIIYYATPKMKAEFKEKLLAIKAISDS